jgi:hypothetical protein
MVGKGKASRGQASNGELGHGLGRWSVAWEGWARLGKARKRGIGLDSLVPLCYTREELSCKGTGDFTPRDARRDVHDTSFSVR